MFKKQLRPPKTLGWVTAPVEYYESSFIPIFSTRWLQIDDDASSHLSTLISAYKNQI